MRNILIAIANWHFERYCAIMSIVIGEPVTPDMVLEKVLADIRKL